MDMKDNRNFKIALLLCLVSILSTSIVYVTFRYMEMQTLRSDLNNDFNQLYREYTRLKKKLHDMKKKTKENKKGSCL